MLRACKAWQAAEGLAFGEAYRDSGLVFTDEAGAGLHPERVTKGIRKGGHRGGAAAVPTARPTAPERIGGARGRGVDAGHQQAARALQPGAHGGGSDTTLATA
jgi:hypothetical protein